MLHAVLEDLSSLPDLHLTSLVSTAATERFALLEALDIEVVAVEASKEFLAFRDLVHQADAVLVIAPEFDNLLYQRCLCVEQAGRRLLGPSSNAIRLAGDKLLLARQFENCSICSPTTISLGHPPFTADMRWPAVCKPRHGAGSQATFLVRDSSELKSCGARAEQEGWQGELLLQPFIPGLASSVAFLTGPEEIVALPPCRQHLSDDGRFHFLGGALPLPPDLAERAVALGRRSVASVPGLNGYVGVDLVLGALPNGGDDAVIEINPRLTTSYVGLRALAEFNLAETMLHILEGRTVPGLKWRTGSVVFHCHGQVEWRD
jgi:predicted ATP-grasp superfamily ATP-dependent carboligase